MEKKNDALLNFQPTATTEERVNEVVIPLK